MLPESLAALEREIVACARCPRLPPYLRAVAERKRAAYRDWAYWGRPVPSFGDPDGRLLVVGLAPGAHGANRTGRLFTGDSSADFLFAALHEAGYASQPTSRARDDGLAVRDAWISAAARCAPPDNRPRPDELDRCRPFLVRELELLPRLRGIVALGAIAFDAVGRALVDRGLAWPRPRPRFGHGVEVPPEGGRPWVFASYHPSRQNTQTGRLTPPMLVSVLRAARLKTAETPGRR